MSNVGFCRCENWAQALVRIGTFRTGEEQLLELRDSFTSAYTSWLRNLNHLCAIDVAIASVLATLSGAAILESSLSIWSRLSVGVPLILSLIALIFAIRAFTSKYSSGGRASKSIGTKSKQWFNILLGVGGPREKARPGDAIHEYLELRDKDTAMQANAHRQFFYRRYEAHNPRALMNLRMYEMRMLNYVRAYAEHLASRTLVWAATSLVIWVVLVAFLDTSAMENQLSPASEVEQRQVDPQTNNDSVSSGEMSQE